MNVQILRLFLCIFLAASASACKQSATSHRAAPKQPTTQQQQQKMTAPYEHLIDQRSINGVYDERAVQQAFAEAKTRNNGSKMLSSSAMEWKNQGPGNIGGRFNAIAIHPSNNNIMYAGAAHGGIYKTTNGGTSWLPIFDEQSSLAIAHIAISPLNPNHIWVGTGDCNISGNVFVGDGIYFSPDGGATWQQKGLSDQKIVAQVALHPTNPNIVYAATMGNPFEKNMQRGLYKTTDGGTTWSNILFANDSTGVISIVLDPNDANTIYASTYTRTRSYKKSVASGTESDIWVSYDAGATFAKTFNFSSENLSRINLIAHPNSGSTALFASVVTENFNLKGIYKSTDGAATWAMITDTIADGFECRSFGWYFANLFVDPNDVNHLVFCAVDLYETYDGGATWALAAPDWWTYEVHADKHWVDFDIDGNVLLCTDGGLYKRDASGIWLDIENISVSQFYQVAVNYNDGNVPPFYYGGMQDNGTSGGNEFVVNDWARIYGGDGFQPGFIKTQPEIMFVETQYGNLNYSDDYGLSFYDFTTGINFSDTAEVWNMKWIHNATQNTTLYCGTNVVYKTNDAPFDIWTPISGVLTEPWIDGERNHYISALGSSPHYATSTYCGTADGHLWKTSNDAIWSEITGTLPDRVFTSIKFSNQNSNKLFVTQQGYRYNDNTPHIYMSANSGSTWVSIAGDLPNVGINDLIVMPDNDSLLMIATDVGVYISANAGNTWQHATPNLPQIPFLDIELDTLRNTFVGGTFARGMFTISQDSIFDAPPTIIGIAEQSNFQPFVHCSGGHLQVRSEQPCAIKVYSAAGQLVHQQNMNATEIEFVLPNSKGVYLVEIISNNNQRKVVKIVNE
jgi:photosystem II stability/assembly factor-like uncharacterized protein